MKDAVEELKEKYLASKAEMVEVSDEKAKLENGIVEIKKVSPEERRKDIENILEFSNTEKINLR